VGLSFHVQGTDVPRKQQHTFTKSQIEKVHRMKAEGYSQIEVAEAVGLKTSSQLNWYIRTGALGDVPKRQGHRSHKQYTDNEQTGQLFGQRKQDWERRLKGIQAGWSPDEEQRRQKGIMPLGGRAYGLREKPGHRNPWKK